MDKDDLTKARPIISLAFNKHNGGKHKPVRELMSRHRAMMIGARLEPLKTQRSTQINLRVYTAYTRPGQSFDVEVEWGLEMLIYQPRAHSRKRQLSSRF